MWSTPARATRPMPIRFMGRRWLRIRRVSSARGTHRPADHAHHLALPALECVATPARIDRDRIPIPQADEQQRLFARPVKQLVAQARPRPELWYFPDTAKTMLILTGDAHAHPETMTRTRLTASTPTAPSSPSICLPVGASSMMSWRKAGEHKAMSLAFTLIPTSLMR